VLSDMAMPAGSGKASCESIDTPSDAGEGEGVFRAAPEGLRGVDGGDGVAIALVSRPWVYSTTTWEEAHLKNLSYLSSRYSGRTYTDD
jgi:hypothetical protein